MSKPIINLYLIPTVLSEGTKDQVLSPQINEVISATDVFFVENVRTARRFISSLKLGKVIDNITFYELTKDTPRSETMVQVKGLTQNAGILSEAGCPGVADPGAVAVDFAHQAGIRVTPLVGPSSILLALMASGMSGQSFTFHGYLPIDKAERRLAIQQLERDVRQKDQTQIFMETPFRNSSFLESILEAAQPETLLCIASNITSPEEFIQTHPVKYWKKNFPDIHKQPTIFLIG
jgi:16S rRNA (cytidine1402-2'-O)-methyltransferase